MKANTYILGVVAVFSIAALASVPGAALAEPSTIPSQGDGTGPGFQRGQEKNFRAKAGEAQQLAHDAAVNLHVGRYAQAEIEARQSLALNSGNGVPAEILAATLEAQGKDQEALEQYQKVVEHYDKQSRNLLPYAQLLLKSGKWAEAVAVYNQALPSLGDDELEKRTSHFSPDVAEPLALEIALHLERGQIYNGTRGWAGDTQNTEAMAEYGKALQLAPNNALTNYYYGAGWQKLSPTERTKFGTVQQAKTHLQKAVKTGNADVKAAAQKALKELG